MSEQKENNTIDFSKPFQVDKFEEIVSNKNNYKYIKDNNLTIISYKTKNDGMQCFAVNGNLLKTLEVEQIIFKNKSEQDMLMKEYKECQLHQQTLKDIIKKIGFQTEVIQKECQ